MRASPPRRIGSWRAPLSGPRPGLLPEERLPVALSRLPWAIAFFLYAPMIYWSGLALKATRVIDFPGFYLAARLAFVEGRSPYGFGALDDYAVALDRWLPPFVYPPPSLLAFWPLTFFSIEKAFILFTVISHLCLLGSVWLILRFVIRSPEQWRQPTLLLCVSVAYMLLSDAVAATLNLGQINIITLFFICLTLTGLEKDTPAWRIAGPLSLAVLLKTYPVLLLIQLFTRRKFRAVALTVAFYVCFFGLAMLLLPGGIWTSWRTQVLPAAVVSKDEVLLFSHSNVSFVWNQSLAGFFTRLFGDNSSRLAPLFHPELTAPFAHAAAAILVLVTVFVAFRARQMMFQPGEAATSRGGDDSAAFLLMIYLVAPVSWDHHLVFILPAAVLALVSVLTGSVRGTAALVLVAALCLIAWRINLEAPLFRKYWWSLLASLKFFAVLTLWAFFVRRLYRAGLRSGPESRKFSRPLQPQI